MITGMDNDNKDLKSDSSLESPEPLAQPPENLDSSNANKVTPDSASRQFKLPVSRRTAIIIAIVILLLISGISITVLKKPGKKTPNTIVVNTQSLDNGTLNRLTSQLGKNNEVKQQLTITPSTLFKSDVTVQGSADIENDLTVKGTSTLFGPVTTGSNLAVGGGLTISRNIAAGGNLSVSGTITGGSLNVGSINISTITLSGNFSWGGHLISTGTEPSASNGVAIGNGKVTVTGNDSIGSVVITAGNSGLLANGEMAIVKFHSNYSGTPIVQLTPASQGAADLPYYVVAAPGFFSVRTTTAPSASTMYTFNYFVAQ
jgi:hypothetical protein